MRSMCFHPVNVTTIIHLDVFIIAVALSLIIILFCNPPLYYSKSFFTWIGLSFCRSTIMRYSGKLLDILVTIIFSIGASAHKVTGNEACAALAASKQTLFLL